MSENSPVYRTNATEPQPTPIPQSETINKFKFMLSSRKFWAAVFGLVLIIVKTFKPDFPLEADQLTAIVSVLAAYILGVALEDGLANRPW